MTVIKLKLTNSIIGRIPKDVTRVSDTVLAGFHLRIGKVKDDGTRNGSYYLYYRLGGRKGKASNFKLGSTKTLTATAARKRAIETLGEIEKGINPQQNKNIKKYEIESSKTDPIVNDLLIEFYSHYVLPNRKRPEEVKRSFDKDVAPTIGKYKLKDLNKRLIVTRTLDPIITRGQLSKKLNRGKVQANKTLSLLKQVFQYGVERGLLDVNPIADIKRQSVGGYEKPRDRFLTLNELRTLLENLAKPNFSEQIKNILHILLLTGCRVGEVTLSEWKHIDFKKNLWQFPPENVKGRKEDTRGHVLPLNDSIVLILKQQQKATQYINSKYVFPCLTGLDKGIKPIDKRSVARAVNRNHLALGLEKFTPHDLRRTVQTQLAAMGVDSVVIEKILNHQLQGMMRVYNQYDYMKERMEALRNWSSKLMSLRYKNILEFKL